MITSRQNAAVKEIRSYKDKKFRDKDGVFVAEGIKLVNEGINSGFFVEKLVCTEKTEELFSSFSGEKIVLKDDVYKSVSNETTPQGVMAVIKKPVLKEFGCDGSAILLDGVADPSNVGAIVRTAAASGYTDLYFTEDCADPFSPKAVRASMGGIFRVKAHISTRDYIAENLNVPFIIADMNGENVFSFNKKGDFCLVIGNEGNGVSEKIRKKASYTVSIPMENGMESLNASVSAGILMYLLKK